MFWKLENRKEIKVERGTEEEEEENPEKESKRQTDGALKLLGEIFMRKMRATNCKGNGR